MTYKIDTFHYLAWHSAEKGQDKHWLAQYQENVNVLDSGIWCWWPGLPLGKHYKVSITVHCHKLVPVLI